MSSSPIVSVSGDLAPPNVRKVWYTAATINATPGSRTAAATGSTGVLQVGHVLVLDPYDPDSKGIGNSFAIPTSGTSLQGKWGVVVAIHDAVNSPIDPAAALSSSITGNRRRGGWVSVATSGYVSAFLDGSGNNIAVWDGLTISPGSSGAQASLIKGTLTSLDTPAESAILQAIALQTSTAASDLKTIALGGYLGLAAG